MKRSAKPRKVGLVSWLIGFLVVGGGLLGLFSLGRAGWMRHLPGVHVSGKEWSFYTGLFDRHPVATTVSALPVLDVGASNEMPECVDAQRGGSWHRRWFEGQGVADSVDVRHLRDQPGFVVRLRKGSRADGPRRFQLTPATPDAIGARRANSIAKELGLMTPELRLVRVRSCGTDMGYHIQQERIDEDFLDRQGLRGVTLVRMGFDPTRPDRQFPVIRADSAEQVKLRGLIIRALTEVGEGRTAMLAGIMDAEAVAAWALMAWIEERDLRNGPVELMYEWGSGRFRPIHQVHCEQGAEVEGDEVLLNMITPLLELPAVRARFAVLQTMIATNWSAWQQREAATNNLWATLIGSPIRPSLTLERATDPRALDQFKLAMRAGPGFATFIHGMPLPPAVVTTQADTIWLAQLAKRHKLMLQGDSIIFPRGKYVIEEDIEFPAGRSVLLQQGARLFMAPGRSILVKGDLYVRGTLRNPVFIRAAEDGRPFGAVAVLGGSAQQCAIQGLYISGGSGAKLAGVQCEGMVTVQGAARTEIASSVFQENGAEASLVVDGGELLMNEVRWEDAAKRFLRLDQVRAVVRDPVMIGARGNATTGLEVRSGTVAVIGGTFTAMQGDAIRAEGAAQLLVRRARISGNAFALRSVGRAEVHVEDDTIDGNEVAFAVEAGAPGDRFVLYPNRVIDNATERSSGAGIVERSALDAATVSRFGVPLVEEEVRASGRSRRN
ncbi:MAG TPA: hypothetical protein PLL57_05970 [Flavobacteriales bacterium]|nr:hypothetical protein [Flavobacteriales bacterium]